MKLARLVGLIATAALALTAVLGATSAMAEETILCKEYQSAPYCKESERYPANTEISASPGFPAESTVTIETSVNIVCSESTITGETSAEAGEPLPVSISAWTLGSCSYGPKEGQTCTVTAVESAPYSGSLNRTSKSDGTMNIGSGGSGNPGWTVKCIGFVDCTYTIEPGFTYKGYASTAEIIATKVPLAKKEGLLCPKAAKFTGTYIMNSPSPGRLAVPKDPPTEPGTALCKSWVGFYCEPADVYPSGTALEGEAGNVVFNGPGSNDLSCESSSMSAETLDYEEGYEVLPMSLNSLSFSGCSIPGVGSCEVSPAGVKGGQISRENGDGAWSGVRGTLDVYCESQPPCFYSFAPNETVMLQHGAPEPGAIDWNEVALEGYDFPGYEAGPCSKAAALEGNYPLSTPSGPLVVTDLLR